LDTAGNLSISAWIYPTTSGNNTWRNIISKRVSGCGSGANYQISLGSQPGNNAGTLTYYTTAGYSSGFIVPINQWTFVAATVQGGNLTLYANGNLLYTATGVSVSPNAGSFYIGTDAQCTTRFAGLIENARVYRRALSSAEVAAIYVGGR
jgi:hypothetical protein